MTALSWKRVVSFTENTIEQFFQMHCLHYNNAHTANTYRKCFVLHIMNCDIECLLELGCDFSFPDSDKLTQ